MIISYEDRPSNYIGLKLLLLSVQGHAPGAQVTLYTSEPAEDLAEWCAEQGSSLKQAPTGAGNGWNIKPSLLRQTLREGHRRAVWLDGDIIVSGDPRSLWSNLQSDVLLVAEEYGSAPNQGSVSRTKAWGWRVGRQIPVTTNSCVVAASTVHADLLEAWEQALRSPEYVAAQDQPWFERPDHLAGDQDVLCALLGSTRFAHVPLAWVRRGKEVAHCFGRRGYVLHERVGNLLRGKEPVLLHGQGPKPWHPTNGDVRAHLDVSPYLLAASTYAERLDEQVDWTFPQFRSSRAIRKLFGDRLTLTGTPLALLDEARDLRLIKAAVRKLLRSNR